MKLFDRQTIIMRNHSSFRRSIVFIWSQYDGVNIEQRTIGYGWRQNHEAKLKNVGGAMS